ncbi:hypothetical protein AVEN_124508-1 [Araneus ventricosus]|uniref:Uncharacterized protein n=1 Tax=Araneus ventricosus TaxID=182803 RepID=A0A4Y2U3T1_ARAVE|nr:hypothetical protein AVEN_124508-1 [Araneus ventricosus]
MQKCRKIFLLHATLKPRSYGLSFPEFRPRFALFPVVGTGRIDMARGLVSASVVSRVMAVNGSHVKGGEEWPYGVSASVPIACCILYSVTVERLDKKRFTRD